MPAAALGDQLASCGVASAAVYFPGFHHSVDNDLLWGEGWTEWVNLRGEVNDTVASSAVRHPRRGYYDIWDGGAATSTCVEVSSTFKSLLQCIGPRLFK